MSCMEGSLKEHLRGWGRERGLCVCVCVCERERERELSCLLHLSTSSTSIYVALFLSLTGTGYPTWVSFLCLRIGFSVDWGEVRG
jgi:hypothetical protein